MPEDLGDRRCRDAHADTGELADDPLVTPARVLTRKPQHQLTDLLGDRRSAGSPPGIHPPPAHELAMPAQQCLRADEERRPARLAEQSAGRSQEDAVTLVQPRMGDLAAKDRELVPENHNLELLVLARAQPQRRHRKHTPKQQVQQRRDQQQPPLRPSPWKGRLYGCDSARGALSYHG